MIICSYCMCANESLTYRLRNLLMMKCSNTSGEMRVCAVTNACSKRSHHTERACMPRGQQQGKPPWSNECFSSSFLFGAERPINWPPPSTYVTLSKIDWSISQHGAATSYRKYMRRLKIIQVTFLSLRQNSDAGASLYSAPSQNHS